MEFSNLYFIYLFLPLCLAVYFLIPGMRRKNMALIVASLLLYAMGQPYYVPLLLLTAYVNYLLGRRVRVGERKTLLLPLLIDLGVLVLVKYLDFLLGIFGLHGADGGGVLGLVAPIGISYYTFQLVSYHVDVYHGKCKASDSFTELLLFICMFPKMPTGPIVRYEQVQMQLHQRRTNPRAAFQGGVRFVTGLAKKVLIADYAFSSYEALAKQPYGAAAWLGALLYMFFIYFEFSGCADMAIGLGRIFGFRYPENFDLPYTSRSITEFWRRWHITLGSFFRDYVYIPLGGNRRGTLRRILNLLVVWALTGLWHGAKWNYLIWGLYFFVLLAVEKQLMPKLERLPYAVRLLITMFFVLIGWVIFANEDMAAMGNTFALMFGKGDFWNASVGVLLKNALPLLGLCLLGSSVLPRWGSFIWSGIFLQNKKSDRISVKQCVYALGMLAFAAVLLYLCTASLIGSASKASLYGGF